MPETDCVEISMDADPTSAVADGAMLDAFASAATLLFPAARSAVDATAARRKAKDDGGEPVRSVPLANESAAAAARFAARATPAAASITTALFEAAATEAPIAPSGSVAYEAAEAVAKL